MSATLFTQRSRPAVRTQADRVVTAAGIVIGSAYQRPAPRTTADADALQHALLMPRRRAAAWARTLAAGLAALAIHRSK